jgi:hypothetical protein
VLVHEPIEGGPRNPLHETLHHARILPHGADLRSDPEHLADARNRVESTPCAPARGNEPDSIAAVPTIRPFSRTCT